MTQFSHATTTILFFAVIGLCTPGIAANSAGKGSTPKKSRRAEMWKSQREDLEAVSTSSTQDLVRDEELPPSQTRFNIQGQSGYFTYEEPGLMREYGALYGARLTVETSQPLSQHYFIGEFDFLKGDITYDGAYDNGTPVKSPTRDLIWAARGLMGFPNEQYVDHQPTLMPFVGLAYRSLNDIIEGRGGYERQISYLYLPVGLRIGGEMAPDTSVAANMEADLLLAGSVKSHLSDVSSEYPDITNRQEAGSGYGLQADVSFHYKTASFGLHFQPFVQYWNIKTSQPVYVYSSQRTRKYVEPDNNSTLWGARIGIDL